MEYHKAFSKVVQTNGAVCYNLILILTMAKRCIHVSEDIHHLVRRIFPESQRLEGYISQIHFRT